MTRKLALALVIALFASLPLAFAEGRVSLVNATVLTLQDSGSGSLRAALASGASDIYFAAGLGGVIPLQSTLALPIAGVTLHAPSQPITLMGNDTFPLITIDEPTGDGLGYAINGLILTRGGGTHGGAIRITEASITTLTLNEMTIHNNHTTVRGGAIDHPATSGGQITITASTFHSNSAPQGGAIAVDTATLTVINSVLHDNGGDDTLMGGAIFHEGSLVIHNSTLANNRAVQSGSTLQTFSSVSIKNSILTVSDGRWRNCSGAIHLITADSASIQYPLDDCGSGPSVIDPRLSGSYTLAPDSPAIDSGDSTTCNLTDRSGATRLVDGNDDGIANCDVGAYEFNGDARVTLAYSTATIRPGGRADLIISLSNVGANSAEKNVTFLGLLPDGLAIPEDALIQNTCVGQFNVDRILRRVTLTNGEIPTNAICTLRVTVTATSTARIAFGEDQLFSNLSAPGTIGAQSLNVGIYSCDAAGYESAAAIGGTAVFDCKSDTIISLGGRGVLLPSSSRLDGFGRARFQPGRGTSAFRAGTALNFNGLTLRNTGSTGQSSTIYVQTGSTLRINNTEYRNYAALVDSNGQGGRGGVLYVRSGATAIITNSTFADNSAALDGGAIYVEQGGTLWLVNSALAHNSAGGSGGAIYAEAGARVTLTHVTIAGNTAALTGGGIVAENGAIVEVGNSILADNRVGVAEANCVGAITPSVGASVHLGGNIEFPGNSCGTAATDADPKLMLVNGNRYVALLDSGVARENGSPTYTTSLSSDSPAINGGIASLCASGAVSGENSTALLVNGLDQRGWARVGLCDSGAVEVHNAGQPSLNRRPRLALTLTPSGAFVPVGTTISAVITPYYDVNNSNIYDIGDTIAYGYTGTIELGILSGGVFNPLEQATPLTFRRGTQSCAEASPTCQAARSIAFRLTTPGTVTIVARDTLAHTSTAPQLVEAALTLIEPPRLVTGFSPHTVTDGSSSTLVYQLSNPNPDILLTGVTYDEVLPTGMQLVSPATPVYQNCSSPQFVPDPVNTGKFSISLASLSSATECLIRLQVTTSSAGRFVLFNNLIDAVQTNPRETRLNTPALEVIAQPIALRADFPTAASLSASRTLLTYTLHNLNRRVTGGVQFVDTLPAAFSDPQAVAQHCLSATVSVAGQELRAANVSVPIDNCTITFDVTATTAEPLAEYANPVAPGDQILTGAHAGTFVAGTPLRVIDTACPAPGSAEFGAIRRITWNGNHTGTNPFEGGQFNIHQFLGMTVDVRTPINAGVSISDDGRWLAFSSEADNLASVDANGTRDVFLYDVHTCRAQIQSVTPRGVTSAYGVASSYPILSGDGARLSFSSTAADLDNGSTVITDNNAVRDIYSRHLADGTTLNLTVRRGARALTLPGLTIAANAVFTQHVVTQDGRYMLAQVNTSKGLTLVRLDRNDPPLASIFVFNPTPAPLNGDLEGFSISPDGVYAAFAKVGKITADDTDPADQEQSNVAMPLGMDIFRASWGSVSNAYSAITIRSVGVSSQPAMTPLMTQGGEVVFITRVAGYPGDTNGQFDVYRFSPNVFLSRTAANGWGAGGAVHPAVTNIAPANAVFGSRWVAWVGISDDFVAGDSNGVADIFVRDNDTAVVARVSVTADGAQAVGGHSYSPSFSGNGEWIAFISSATNLVPGDDNGQPDIFVVRNPLYVAPAPDLPGDADGDGRVTIVDFSLLAAAFGTLDDAPGYDERVDFNGDGRVDLADYALLAEGFGRGA